MPFEVQRDAQRGHVDHGWLKAAHSFSFGRYVDPERTHFGALLVVNEDVILPGGGFGEHFHDNMEIVTIPLSGALRHGDSLGNGSVISAGEVQVMSAGTGIMHSEHNASTTEPVRLLQIWIVPEKRGLDRRYAQRAFTQDELHNVLRVVAGPGDAPDRLRIHQDARVSFGRFDAGRDVPFPVLGPDRGLFMLVVDGRAEVLGDVLEHGDALTAWDGQDVMAKTVAPTALLAIEVPMGVG